MQSFNANQLLFYKKKKEKIGLNYTIKYIFSKKSVIPTSAQFKRTRLKIRHYSMKQGLVSYDSLNTLKSSKSTE
jgi:hypothetical protein